MLLSGTFHLEETTQICWRSLNLPWSLCDHHSSFHGKCSHSAAEILLQSAAVTRKKHSLILQTQQEQNEHISEPHPKCLTGHSGWRKHPMSPSP